MKRCPVIASFRNGTQHHLSYFLSNPALEVGIPVSRANFCLACVIPSARFKENETPGILNFDINYNYFNIHLPKRFLYYIYSFSI